MAGTDNDNTTVGAGADATVVVPDVHPTQRAWSSEADTEISDQSSWGIHMAHRGRHPDAVPYHGLAQWKPRHTC